MTEKPRGQCVDLGFLFDSVDPDHHQRAKALCDVCPRFDLCGEELVRYLANPGPGYPVEGTWAGRLLVDARRPKRRKVCGTPSGAAAHRRRHERVCDDCYEARLADDREREGRSTA